MIFVFVVGLEDQYSSLDHNQSDFSAAGVIQQEDERIGGVESVPTVDHLAFSLLLLQ